MRIINRLREPGEIRSVRLESEKVTVRLVDDEIIIYRRSEDEDVGVQESVLRRRPFPSQLPR